MGRRFEDRVGHDGTSCCQAAPARTRKPATDPDLERQEGGDLRQRHDVGGRPAGIQQRLQRRRRGVARVEHQQVHVLERGGQTPPQHAADFRRDTIGRSGGVLAAQRAGGIGAVGALSPGRRDRRVDRAAQFRRGPAGGQAGGVERGDLRLAVQAGDEGGDRETLGRGDPAGSFRREQRAIAGLRLLARVRPPAADRVQRRAGLDPDQRVDDVRVLFLRHGDPLPCSPSRDVPRGRPVARAPSPAPAPPHRPPVRSTAG